ncbi:MAG TPA: D-glutamate deacylase, partial [Yeosuana sp.]
MKKTLLTLFITALIFSSCKETTTEKGADTNQEFDVVILNGRVMDPETNFDGIRNVGVKDGKIALITEASISGKEIIDAT